jgi:protein-L-isoaspartate(D-aspartate) O-methyltransferase
MKPPASFIDKVIRPACNDDPRIVSAFQSVPREFFMDEAMKLQAYVDNAQPIGFGQTISQPSLVAMMLYELEITQTSKCLEVGAGSGYVSALFGRLADEVYGLELLPELARIAQDKLRQMGINNVRVISADGSLGYPSKAPFDRIMISAGAKSLPETLVEQLAEGGVMIIPLNGVLTKVRKIGGTIEQKQLARVVFVDFVGT